MLFRSAGGLEDLRAPSGPQRQERPQEPCQLQPGHLGRRRECCLAPGTQPDLAAASMTPVLCEQVWPLGEKRAAGGVAEGAQQAVWVAGSGPSMCCFVQAGWVSAVGQAQAHGFGQTPRLALTPLGPLLPLHQQPCTCPQNPPSPSSHHAPPPAVRRPAQAHLLQEASPSLCLHHLPSTEYSTSSGLSVCPFCAHCSQEAQMSPGRARPRGPCLRRGCVSIPGLRHPPGLDPASPWPSHGPGE